MREKSLRQKVVLAVLSVLAFSLEANAEEISVTLSDHWKRPAAAAPAGFSLLPEKCGSCHAAQYEKWKSSLHAKAIGPGLLGQYDAAEDFSFSASCRFCHAPLQEQQEGVEREDGEFVPNPGFDQRLAATGVGCPSCHVRNGKVLGPPESGSLKVTKKAGKNGHNLSGKKEFFGDSEFCASCHQLDNGYRLAGKLLVNTYGEWKQSQWAENGVSCQGCHMPGREHLFRGIHDRETTLNALTLELQRDGNQAVLTIENSGAGHFFPTYVTPLVEVRMFERDVPGKIVDGSLKREYIGRKVSLDLQREEFDTRIPPGGKMRFRYKSLKGTSTHTVFELWVFPDNFYRDFYEVAIRQGSQPSGTRMQEALKNAESSPYLLWRGEIE